MISKLTRCGRYAFFPFLIPENNPYDKVEVLDQNYGRSDETGWDRIKALFKSHQDQTIHPKLASIMQTAMMSFVVGGAIGAIKSSRITFIRFIENNEATKFDNHLVAKRQLSDKMFASFLSGGLGMGIKISFFCTSLITAYVLLSTYRNKDAIWYYTAGGAYAGAMYKFSLGPKGMISGGIFGGLFGTLYGSFHYLILQTKNWTEEEYRDSVYKKRTDRDEAVSTAFKNMKTKRLEEDLLEQMDVPAGK